MNYKKLIIASLLIVGMLILLIQVYNVPEKQEEESRISLGVTKVYDYKNDIVLYYTPQGEFLTYGNIQ